MLPFREEGQAHVYIRRVRILPEALWTDLLKINLAVTAPPPPPPPPPQSPLLHLEPDEARWTLIDYLRGRASAEVTIPRLILAFGYVEEVEACLDQVARRWKPPVPPALRRLVRMVRERRRGLERTAANLSEHPDPTVPF